MGSLKGTPLRIDGRFRTARAVALFCLACAGVAWGQASDAVALSQLAPATREEARRRFDQGIALYNVGDFEGALAEFQRAARLTGHPLVLYNLALVQSRLGLSAEAVATLERLKELDASELGRDRMARVRDLYVSESARVGTLVVTTRPTQALVQVDGVDTARTPTGPIRVSAGSHFIAVSAPGHEPQHVKISVAGGANEALDLELRASAGAPGELNVHGGLPGVEVHVDGVLLGTTPLRNGLVLNSGAHELVLRRAGYIATRQQLTLPPGGRANVLADLVPLPDHRGPLLRLAISEPGAVVTVDGRPRWDYGGGLRLPTGPHLLRVERSGFLPIERQIVVRGSDALVDVKLLPTPAYLARYLERTERQRMASYVMLSAGALAAVGGGTFLIWNQGQKNEAKREFDAFVREVESASPSQRCRDDVCEKKLGILAESLEAKRGRDVYGWATLGVGAAALSVGTLVLLMGDDPKRYKPETGAPELGGLAVRVTSQALEIRGVF
jgi:PEGA domain